MEDTQESILRKIKALLKKAEGTDNEHEAASFAAAAQRLIAKYNVELADLQEKKVEIVLSRYELLTQHRWHKTLMNGVTTANFCKFVFYRGSKRIDMIGEAHNIDVCIALYDYLTKEIVRLAQSAYTSAGYVAIGQREWKYNFWLIG